jgi:hypothetical protein
MDRATLATTIANLFFSEALKEGGKTLGKGVSETAGRFIGAVKAKFESSGKAELLNLAKREPNPQNIENIKDELRAQIGKDSDYRVELRQLVEQLKSMGVVRQVMASSIEVEETLEAESLTQTSTGGEAVNQEMLTDVKAKNIKLGDLNQKA